VRSWASPRAALVALGALLLLITVVISGGFAARVCAEPLDVSGTRSLPRVVSLMKQIDEIAYPAHAVLGLALEGLDCDPLATGLQWLKAAAHARSAVDVSRAAAGMARAELRSSDVGRFRTRLCAFVGRTYARPEQASAVREAGLTCSLRG
jgi:hypothetical protein